MTLVTNAYSVTLQFWALVLTLLACAHTSREAGIKNYFLLGFSVGSHMMRVK